ncbi:MAG: hypothetical protein VX770_08945 [Candidatus Neomarinimicrobiota bacterium]|nr:hypothetical protein [Candidatus Neomarinimicrobiota bacterium]
MKNKLEIYKRVNAEMPKKPSENIKIKSYSKINQTLDMSID